MRRAFRLAVRASALAFAALFVILGAVAFYARDLPAVDGLSAARLEPRVLIVDMRGETLGIRGQDRGEPVSAADLPDHVVGAFVATEDRNFFHHVGVNPVAILRALLANIRAGSVEEGGSTITQQLVKNLLLSPEQTIERKIQEMALAIKIELRYEKNEILSLYLNRVYFGNGAFGIEAAARRYYGKHPEDLTVGEAAMLAGLLKAPTRYAPTNNAERAIARAKVVLNAMTEAGYIDAATRDGVGLQVLAENVAQDVVGAYAADHALVEAKSRIGEINQDIIIRTTIDGRAMRATADARRAIADQTALYTPEVQTAALVLHESGAVRVLIGGNDYGESAYNRATQARRQPGSTFKPFVYLAALEAGWRPESKIDDTPVRVGKYRPENYGEYHGRVSLTEALSKSYNAAVIRLQEQVGRERVVDVAQRLGWQELKDPGPSLGLGVVALSPLELATTYLPLANGGFRTEPFIVASIETPEGKTLYRHAAPKLDQVVLGTQTLVAFDHMMRATVTSGSGRRAAVAGHVASGKTGTSQKSRDAWFAGYASGHVGIVWLGRDDDGPMEQGGRAMYGSGAPAQLWSSMMTASLKGKIPRPPTPYVPVPEPSLFDHLSTLLRLSEKEDVSGAAEEQAEDPIRRLIIRQ